MRIRKNAKLGSVPLEKLQTHVCQLNQSPWDVIPFGPDPTQFEVGEEDSSTGNGNGGHGDSVGAVESVASMMDAEDKSPLNIEDVVVDDNDDDGIIALDKAEGNKTTPCRQCKDNEANKQGQSFFEHNNLSSIRSPSSKKATAVAGARRARARALKKAPTTTSNPYEFYYYSGFGPLWGKRRGDRNGGFNNKNEAKAKGCENSTITEANATTILSSSPCSSSQIDNEGFDYADDYDDDEEADGDDDEEEIGEGNGESGKKRMRKPVKARSLKSLM